jgi:hypothetical protein
MARFVEHALTHLRVRATTQDFNRDATIQLLVVRGINETQPAFAELSFDAKAGQSRRFFFMLGWRTALAFAQLAHMQAGLDALAGFVANTFG